MLKQTKEIQNFTREKFDVGDAPTHELQSIVLQEGKGLKGDRFEFSKYPVTLFSLEVAQEVCSSLDLELDIKLFRRNIIIAIGGAGLSGMEVTAEMAYVKKAITYAYYIGLKLRVNTGFKNRVKYQR